MSTQRLLMGDLNIPIPGTDFTKWSSALESYLGLSSWFDAADIAGKVSETYPAVSRAAGVPYQINTDTGEAMVQTIADQTGLSFGRVKAALNVLQDLASKGEVGNDLYNPGKFSVSVKVAAAVSSAVSGAKKVAEEVTPKAVKDLVSGASEGVSGVGTLLQFLPWIAIGGLGLYAWSIAKSGKRPSLPGPLGKFL